MRWNWGTGQGEGQVVKTFDHSVTMTLDGSEITRNGGQHDRALLIEQAGGAQVLKLESECQRADEEE